MSEDAFELKTQGLDKLIKSLKGKAPYVKVGILGNANLRSDGKSNALVGAAHEFGTTTLPQRSFLRMPLNERLNKELESSGALSKKEMEDVIKQGSLTPWLDKIGSLAVSIVLSAFDTGGFGKWKSLKSSTLSRKKNYQILVETQQLRDSITAEVHE